ncbi:MAG: metallophosphoesterase [Fimbriimonadales bacterium]|nr:MAG: metallophosphoesterase [Fimbriimonadales bacterium]GIV10766.1 MAG: metallophosphoesterase [Fimbriimonadales bacterium]
MLRLAHTADVHLGRAFGYLGEAAEAHQERLTRSFRRVFAQAQSCHAMLIAGDLFDSPRVGRRWLEVALSVISESGLPVIAIPGNHDPAAQHPFREISLPSNLHFLPETGRIPIDELDLEVIACPAGDTACWAAALQRTPNGAPFQIALMHGSMPSAGGQGDIRPEWIAQSELDYIALGDWHSPQDWSRGRTACWYSGAPEMIMPRQQLPAAMLVIELAQGQPARVQTVPVGEARMPEGTNNGVLDWDLSAYRDTQALLSDLRALLTPETVARIRLTGRWAGNAPLNLQLLSETLQPACLWLELQSAFQLELLQPHTPFETMLTELAQAKAAQHPEQASLYYEATQTALHLLRGGRL